MPHSKTLPPSDDPRSVLYKLQHGGRRRDSLWLARFKGNEDGWWPDGPEWGPPSARRWSLTNRAYARAREQATHRRQLFDAATPEQLEVARRWLVNEAREHEAEDATPEQVLHAIERLYQPGGWAGFTADRQA